MCRIRFNFWSSCSCLNGETHRHGEKWPLHELMKSVHHVSACAVKTAADFSCHADSHLKFTKIIVGVKLINRP